MEFSNEPDLKLATSSKIKNENKLNLKLVDENQSDIKSERDNVPNFEQFPHQESGTKRE